MEKTERLLDLIALFLDAAEPISWAELREAFPDEYGKGSDEACERKFERDKAELVELGVALEYRPPTDDGKEGYVLARQSYYLPEIGFSPEETAVLFAAGSAALAAGAFPGRSDLAHALRKIAFTASEPQGASGRLFADLDPAKPAAAQHLELLWQALLARKRVTLQYSGLGRGEQTRRTVDPYGVCLRRGSWVMTGYCHLRKAERTFHVDRILELSVNRERPKSADYEVPQDFHIGRIAGEQVWQHHFHAAMEVELELSEELSPYAARHFPGAQLAQEGRRATVRATYLDGLLRRVLALEGVAVRGPAAAVARMDEMLAALRRGHAEETR